MTVKVGVVGILLLLMSVASASADDCTLKQFASLTMTLVPDGPIIIPVTIQGSSHQFRLAAFSPSEIDAALANSLKFDHEEVREDAPMFVGTQQIKNLATIPQLTLGDSGNHLDLPSTEVAEDPVARATTADPEGTLGHEYLRYFDLDFDFGNGKLNIFSPDHCAGKVVYWAKEYTDVPIDFLASLQSITQKGRKPNPGLMSKTMRTPSGGTIAYSTLVDSFMGKLNGLTMPVSINTGIARTRMSMDMAQALFDLAPTSQGMERIADAQDTHATRYLYHFASLEIGDISIKNPTIELWSFDPSVEAQFAAGVSHDIGERFPKPPALELGTDVLRHLHVYVAVNENRLYVTAADAHH